MAGQRRRWGWHQLHPRAAEELVAGAGLPDRSLVLDIGAGLGALTAPLVDAGHRVVAVEAHPDRARRLRARFGEQARVVQVDASDLRLPRRPFHVVANPPFDITSALLRRLLHPKSRLVTAHLVLDDRAVRRWTGPRAPGMARWWSVFELTRARPVRRSAFSPRPHVDSRVLVVRRR